MKTPNLDKLAKSGVIFTQGYVTDATCGPSRAGLITGKYQKRFGYEQINLLGYMSENSKFLGDDMGLPLGQSTIADYLKKLGYKSAMYSKWHLGDTDRYHPLKRKFDEFYGFRVGARSYFGYEKITIQVAVKRGPVVYCVESADLPVETSVIDVYIKGDSKKLTAEYRSDFIGGVSAITGEVLLRNTDNGKGLQHKVKNPVWEGYNTTFVPYYAGLIEMREKKVK